MSKSARAIIIVVVLWSFCRAFARADDFRISTEVFSGDNQQPVARNETIFQGDKVYDFALHLDRVAVFDFSTQQFELADLKRGVRTKIAARDLMAMVAGMTEKAKNSPKSNKVIRFAAAPDFDVKIEAGQIALESKLWSYTARTRVAPDGVLSKYQDFLNWYTRLNAPQTAMPPHARLRLNEVLAQQKRIPTEVERSIKYTRATTRYRSKHQLFETLKQEDLRRIKIATQHLQSLPEVGFDVYLDPKLAQKAGDRKQR